MRLELDADGDACAQPKQGIELQSIYDKLYNYEQAEEKSLILVLPVSLGSKVYQARKSCCKTHDIGLFTGKPLDTCCPYYDAAYRVCRKVEPSVGFDSALEPTTRSPVNILEAPYDDCFLRIYPLEVEFRVDMINKVIGRTIKLNEETVFLSVDYMLKVMIAQTSYAKDTFDKEIIKNVMK